MTIGVDARCLEWQRGGVARFLVKFLELAPETNKDYKFILYFQNNIPNDAFLSQPNVFCKIIKGPNFLKKRRILCEQILMPFTVWSEKVDCFFSPWYTCPLVILYKKIFVAAWDISYLTHPKQYTFFNRISLGFFGSITYKYANGIITCSNFDANQILKYTKVQKENILIFNFPAEDKFDNNISDAEINSTLSKLQIKTPYILSLGVIYNRRNIPSLIEAFKKVSNNIPNLNLVIIGKNATSPKINFNKLIKSLNLNNKITLIDYLDESDLVPVYKASKLFYCTTDSDGEAILIKEALRAGIPVISSSLLEDTINGFGTFIENPDNDLEIFKTIEKVISLPPIIIENVEKGKKWIKTIKWDNEILKTMNFIKLKSHQ